MSIIRNVYIRECPNCGGPIDDDRLSKGLVCRRCLPDINKEVSQEELLELLVKNGTLKRLKPLYNLMVELRYFQQLFLKALDSSPWSAQKTWARRVLSGRSFSIIAPTGVGKTVFGLLISLYLSTRGYKSYIVLPTTPLVVQAIEKLEKFKEKTNINARILGFHARMKQSERRKSMELLEKGDYDILVTTSRFMLNNHEIISKHEHKFFFVDDVDAVLKSGKSIISLLKVMGFTEKDLSIATELTVIRRRIASLQETRGQRELSSLIEKFKRLEHYVSQRRKELGRVLVVSSATGRPRGSKVLLFRELLGFQVGSRPELLRNIIDSYYIPDKTDDIEKSILRLVSELGEGGLVFVPVDKGVEYAEKIAEKLRKNGIKAEAFHSKNQKALDNFISGKTKVLVGVAVYYGVMVRGLDLPWLIRYAVFAGVPRFKFSLEFEDPHPTNVFRLLSILVENIPEDLKTEARRYYINVRRIMKKLSPAALQVVAQKLREGKEPESDVEKEFYEATRFIRKALGRRDVREILKYSKDVVLREEQGRYYIYIPDLMTYIQASGRTSRLYAGGLTKGLSVVIVDDMKLFENMVSRMKWYIEDMNWVNYRELEKKRVLSEIDEDRKKVVKVIRGEFEKKIDDLVRSVLLVVESPNKARTIASFFGKPSVRLLENNVRAYEVTTGNLLLIITASGGHIMDLPIEVPKKVLKEYGFQKEFYGVMVDESSRRYVPAYTSIKRCLACGNQFVEDIDRCPRCGSPLIYNARETVRSLRDLAMEVDMILIGTDPDTEGEKIGWDLAVMLRPYTSNVRRIEFHEVTRKAIINALHNYRLLSTSLVEAQMVRRIEDRWIGFTLSPKLWRDFWRWYCSKYLEGKYDCKENRNLSAGRVQTPVLGWIIQRYNEHQKSDRTIVELSFKINELTDTISFIAEETRFKEDPKSLEGKRLEIIIQREEEIELAPLPPYTTDTMLTDASKHLGLGAPQAMRLAQDLFELGLITYHRTDSTRVSDTGINIAREYLKQVYGEKYIEYFTPRKWGEGGAHEAIRPTKPIDPSKLAKIVEEGELELPRQLTRWHYRLYSLIFHRFIASQMKKALVVKQVVKYKINHIEITDERIVGKPIDPGFLEMYNPYEFKKRLTSGKYLITTVKTEKRKTVPLYTQGDIVRVMKERKIGRPSTYATIINKLLLRRYVLERGKWKKLVPTKLGIHVYDYLNKEFSDMVSEERTRLLEEKMDRISEGIEHYINVLDELYKEITGKL